MKTFKQFMQENMALFTGPNDPRDRIMQMCNMLTNLEPDEVTDSHDLLLKLRDLVEDILSGKRY